MLDPRLFEPSQRRTVVESIDDRIETLRTKNEATTLDAIATAELRGRIAMCREWRHTWASIEEATPPPRDRSTPRMRKDGY